MCLVLLPNIWPSENNGLINSKPTYFFPDTESEILDLYSSHVVPGCQLSLQRKQNIPPHCKTVKTVTFHLTAWNRNQNTVTSVESNEGKGMLLLWVQQNAYSIWGEGGVRGGDKGQVHKIIQHWTLQVTMNSINVHLLTDGGLRYPWDPAAHTLTSCCGAESLGPVHSNLCF